MPSDSKSTNRFFDRSPISLRGALGLADLSRAYPLRRHCRPLSQPLSPSIIQEPLGGARRPLVQGGIATMTTPVRFAVPREAGSRSSGDGNGRRTLPWPKMSSRSTFVRIAGPQIPTAISKMNQLSNLRMRGDYRISAAERLSDAKPLPYRREQKAGPPKFFREGILRSPSRSPHVSPRSERSVLFRQR